MNEDYKNLYEQFKEPLSVNCPHENIKTKLECFNLIIKLGKKEKANADKLQQCYKCPEYPGKLWKEKYFADIVESLSRIEKSGRNILPQDTPKIRFRKKYGKEKNIEYCLKYRATERGKERYREYMRKYMKEYRYRRKIERELREKADAIQNLYDRCRRETKRNI